MLGKDGWLCLLPFFSVLFVLCHTCDILVPSWVLPSKTNSLGSSSSPFSRGARPQGCDQELHASTEQTQLCSLSGRGSVSYCPVFWCRLQYICLYLWAEISSRLTLINYTPLHTHTTTYHQLSSILSLPREIIQWSILLLRAQTCSNGEEAAFYPLFPECFTDSSSFIQSLSMLDSWDSIFVPIFFPSTCFPSSPWFCSHLFAHTTQIYSSKQDLSPEHQILHHWPLHLQWFLRFLNWIVRSSEMRTMPRSPACIPQGLHFRKHLVYFYCDIEVSE